MGTFPASLAGKPISANSRRGNSLVSPARETAASVAHVNKSRVVFRVDLELRSVAALVLHRILKGEEKETRLLTPVSQTVNEEREREGESE